MVLLTLHLTTTNKYFSTWYHYTERKKSDNILYWFHIMKAPIRVPCIYTVYEYVTLGLWQDGKTLKKEHFTSKAKEHFNSIIYIVKIANLLYIKNKIKN